MTENWLADAENLQKELVEIRRRLHQNAEVGFDLTETVKFVKETLAKHGIAAVDCGKAGVVATVGNTSSGWTFLLRADMDALPMKEESGLPFAAQGGNAHACGHDMHTAMLLGAAALLKAHEDELSGCVKLMFQPAEEILEGAEDMIEAGVLQNPAVDAAMMIHVAAGLPFGAGTVIVPAEGVSIPAADYFEICVQGKGCHGSMPHSGVDPLLTAAQILINLQAIQTRELPWEKRAVLNIGTLSAGSAANIIPDSATMRGSMRAFDEDVRAFMKERITAVAAKIAETFRATASITFPNGCPAFVNNGDLLTCVQKYVKELTGRDDAVVAAEKGATGSEDFAYVSQRVPSLMLVMAAGEADAGYRYPQHHPMVTFDESVLARGSVVYAYTAFRWLAEHT